MSPRCYLQEFQKFNLKALLAIACMHQTAFVFGLPLHGINAMTRTNVLAYHHYDVLTKLKGYQRNESEGYLVTDAHVASSRRNFFQTTFPIFFMSTLNTCAVGAVDVESSPATKPFAALEALQPAVRVKLCIDRATIVATKLIGNPSIDSVALVKELEDLIIQPQNYLKSFNIQGVPKKPAKQYLEAYKPMAGDLPFQRYLIENGDVSAWKDLKKKEKVQEGSNELRAALNAYTDALSFSGNSYLLNVDKDTRSKMVRQDRLPDVKQVITSDMGMRYLYRNQILTAMDDVRAELQYQLNTRKSPETPIDATELLSLLKEAQKACDRWFTLIDPNDVRDAIMTVESDG